MFTGILVLPSNHGGPAEIIHNGHTGILIDDVSVETMRSAVIEFMHNPQLLSSMSLSCIRNRSRYSPEIYKTNLLKILDI